jgi:chemotaxis protein methyltransferase CheR
MLEISEEHFIKFKDIIHKESGIFFDNINKSILESRLRERIRQKNLTNPEEYYLIVTKDKTEMENLLDSVTTNLTKFFRNEKQFVALRQNILPECAERNKNNGTKSIKIWSAGCSTGEEPYTIAMDMVNLFPPTSWKLEILASDLSLKSLMKAKTGYYPRERSEGIPIDYVKKFLNEEKEGFKIKDEVKNIIRFDYHNLKFDNGERNFDIIFCRNVIIYFDKTEQERVVNHFYKCLKNPGYLFLGHSESLFGMNTLFKPVKFADTYIYKKEE